MNSPICILICAVFTLCPAIFAEVGNNQNCYIDNEKIFLDLKYRMIRMAKKKKLVQANLLFPQLKRKTHTATLPISSSVTNDCNLYTSCRKSVFIMGKLYKKRKSPNWFLLTSSAFCLTESGVIATNYHVIAQQDAKYFAAMAVDGTVYGVKEVLAADPINDIAILQLDGTGFKPLPLKTHTPVGANIVVISHPDQYFYYLTNGIISGYYYYRNRINQQSQYMTITAPFGLGSSGAPILDRYGCVVGIVSNTHAVKTKLKSGKNYTQMVIKNCVPAELIKKLFKPNE